MRNGLLRTVATGLLLLLAACGSSYHARDMDLDTTLINPSILEKGTGDQALYRYMNKDADVLKYDKILLDPVMVAKDGELDAETRVNYQRLADNAFVLLRRELGKDYALADQPGEGTMRLQMAILEADPSKPMRNILSSVTPVGIAMDMVEYTATGKQSGVGEISMEMKVTDSLSGELLGAVVDRRVGGENMDSVTKPWSGANDGLAWWAKRVRYFLCVARKGVACRNP
jgi:hypothetical protein